MSSDRHENLTHVSPAPEIPFSAEEYRDRHREIQRRMAVENLDVLYLSSPESRFYVDAFNSDWYQAQSPKSWHALSGVAIKADTDNLIAFEREANVVLAAMTSVADETLILGGDDTRDMVNFVVDSLADAGWLPGRVGIERYSYRPNPAVSELFSNALKARGCEVVDGSDILREVRRIKSPQELEYIREAARIGDVGMRAAAEAIRPGVSELDVYAEIGYAMIKAGGEHPAKAASCASGPRTLCTDAQTSHRKLTHGDVVNIDICGCSNRYHTNYARTFSVGEPSPALKQRVDVAGGMFDEIARAMRPGIGINELTAVMKSFVQEAGVWDERWWIGGYDMGIGFAPDWVGPTIYDPDVDAGEAVFASGTVVNCECDLFLPNRAGLSLVIDTMLFDEQGAELLHTVPRGLNVID